MSYSLLDKSLYGTYSQIVNGEPAARRVAATLVSNGVEFHVEPLPDDDWQITVKRETVSILSMAVFDGEEER